MQADRVWATASTALDVVTAALVSPPARQYVAIGVPALDCEQVAVSIDRIIGHQGNPSTEDTNPVRCLTMRAVELSIWVVRCAPVVLDDGSPPTVAALNASAQEMAGDPPTILQALLDAFRDGTLGSSWGVVFLDARAITPQGGLAGWQQRVRYDLSAPVA